MMLKDRIAIVGIGETPPVRRSEKNIKALMLEAVNNALDDAGINASDVDGVVTESNTAPLLLPHDELAANLGISRLYTGTVSWAGTGIVCSPMVAAMAIATGIANVVVTYFGVDWGSSPAGPYNYHEIYAAKRAFEVPFGYYGQPLYFGVIANRYIHEYGLTARQLGSVAVTQRRHALLHGHAQMQKPLTYEDYERSPIVADPLRVADCCLLTDGACAVVMTSAERAKDCRQQPVYVMGSGFASGTIPTGSSLTQKPDLLSFPAVTEARDLALEMAGISLADVDFAELYDAFTLSCLMEIEDMGFCKKGEAGAFVEAGHTAIGGTIPVNTHGGLLSHSYLLCIEHLVEAVRQLRGQAGAAQVQGARIGLVGAPANPDYGVLILRK